MYVCIRQHSTRSNVDRTIQSVGTRPAIVISGRWVVGSVAEKKAAFCLMERSVAGLIAFRRRTPTVQKT